MNNSVVSEKSTSSKREIISGDSAYNRLYPFPQYLSRKLAVIILMIIVLGLLFGFITSFFNPLS